MQDNKKAEKRILAPVRRQVLFGKGRSAGWRSVSAFSSLATIAMAIAAFAVGYIIAASNADGQIVYTGLTYGSLFSFLATRLARRFTRPIKRRALEAKRAAWKQENHLKKLEQRLEHAPALVDSAAGLSATSGDGGDLSFAVPVGESAALSLSASDDREESRQDGIEQDLTRSRGVLQSRI